MARSMVTRIRQRSGDGIVVKGNVGGVTAVALSVLLAGCGGGTPATSVSPALQVSDSPTLQVSSTAVPQAKGSSAKAVPTGGSTGRPTPSKLLAKKPNPKGGVQLCTRASYTVAGNGLRVTVHFTGPAILLVSVLPDRGKPSQQNYALPAGETSHVFAFPLVKSVSKVRVSVLARGSADTCDASRA